MKKIIAQKDFILNGVDYIQGDEIKNLTYQEIVKLNEKGFIEPLEYKDLVFIKREIEYKKNSKEEKL